MARITQTTVERYAGRLRLQGERIDLQISNPGDGVTHYCISTRLGHRDVKGSRKALAELEALITKRDDELAERYA